MRALTLAFVLHLTLNPLLYIKGMQLLKRYKVAKILWSVLFASEFILYTSVYLFYRQLPAEIVQFGRIIGTSWMLFNYYSATIFIFLDIAYILYKRKLNTPQIVFKQSQKTKNMIFSTVAVVAIIMTHGYYKFKHPDVTRLELSINKSTNEYDSLRVLVVGDLHLGYTINHKDAQRMVDLIMGQKADIILMVGDIIDSKLEPLIEQNVGNILKQLNAPLGIYSCPGNHEYRDDEEAKFQFLKEAGITMLRDSAVLINNSFYIAGREDWIIENRMTTNEILNKYHVNQTLPFIILNHSPYDLTEDNEAGADLALYGHTHHGQAFPGNIATQLKFEVAYGYKLKNDAHVYVTSGLGLAGPQHRIATKSEIAVIELKFTGK